MVLIEGFHLNYSYKCRDYLTMWPHYHVKISNWYIPFEVVLIIKQNIDIVSVSTYCSYLSIIQKVCQRCLKYDFSLENFLNLGSRCLGTMNNSNQHNIWMYLHRFTE